MKVKIRQETLDLLQKDRPDLEDHINAILHVYAMGGFIRSSDVESSFILDKNVYRKNHPEVIHVFDEMTNDFAGIAVIGYSESETLWINEPKLARLIEENTEIIVMKKHRKSGIRTEKGIAIHIDDELQRERS